MNIEMKEFDFKSEHSSPVKIRSNNGRPKSAVSY